MVTALEGLLGFRWYGDYLTLGSVRAALVSSRLRSGMARARAL